MLIVMAWTPLTWAGGPRWVTGLPYFSQVQAGQPVVWYTKRPVYFTDPGDLSATVNHSAADALVAAAAGVWNAPTSALSLAQGGMLAEHVSEANAYVGSTGLVFPADVQAANWQTIQIAVIYDSDGSVTDLMLGSGASASSSCRQNAVTESVDSIAPTGLIEHAVLVLNGRCTGTAPEQQTQMQYQLMRAFGRVLGLGWSQTNDNVFTGTPTPTYQQAMHWPVMHPIDIICGPYTYQCMPQPFVLRDDDLSALAELYPIGQGQSQAGQVDTLLNANQISGVLSFPNGQGMQGVNVLGRRMQQYWNVPEGWYETSVVSGERFRRTNGNPVSGVDTSMAGSMGGSANNLEGWYEFGRVPMLPGDWQWVILETEPVNPLYTAEHSVGPYTETTVAPSGSDPVWLTGIYPSYSQYSWLNFTPLNPVSACGSVGDGTESAPAATSSTGWWTDVLCGYGHTAWSKVSMQARRSMTIEVTAQDELGDATMAKAMPVVGVWQTSDALGTIPTVAAAPAAFNSLGYGMTAVGVSSVQPEQLRIVIADQRGDGRPDFAYQARVLYADTISPASVSYAGGTVTITGTGFRAGNAVLVNGVAATVTSWSATSIVAVVPPSSALGSSSALTANVTVKDVQTGGTTVMTGALSYTATPPNVMTLVSEPSGTVYVGDVAATLFTVKVTTWDGTPVAGATVGFTATGGVVFGACGAATCTMMTNAAGIAATTVTPTAAGAITLSAVGAAGSETDSFTAVLRVRTLTAIQPMEYVAAGATVQWTPQVVAADNSAAVAGTAVAWTVTSGQMTLGGGSSTVNAAGATQMPVTVGPLASGAQALGQACGWGTVCAGFGAVGVDPSAWRLEIVSGAGQAVSGGATLGPVVLRVTDGAGHPVVGAPIQLYQTVDGAVVCPVLGRCPAAPVYKTGQAAAVSDVNGLLNVTPMQMTGIAEATNIAASTGTQGFVSLALMSAP